MPSIYKRNPLKINWKSTKRLKFTKEIPLKVSWKSLKKARFCCASYGYGQTNERTDKKVQSIFFCPYENKATRTSWQIYFLIDF